MKIYQKTKSVNLTSPEAVKLANELAELEDRRVNQSACILFVNAARAKLARLKKKNKQGCSVGQG